MLACPLVLSSSVNVYAVASRPMGQMLSGEHVSLRSIQRSDLPILCDFINNVEVRQAAGGTPFIPRSLAWYEAQFDKVNAGEDGIRFLIVVENAVIGECGLFGFNEYKGVARICDLSISIGDPRYWGRGLGREVIALLLRYAFKDWNMQRVGLRTHSKNERAIRCYRSCGFVEEGRLRKHEWLNGNYVDTVCMSILREEWKDLRPG